MLVRTCAALSLVLVLAACPIAQAEPVASRSQGAAVYEKPAPTPEPVALVVPAVQDGTVAKAIKKPNAHDRIVAVPRHDAHRQVATHDVPPAPTPKPALTSVSATVPAGPVESAAPTLRDLVSKHARANGVPEKLAAAVVNIESRFNPKARGGSALGLMQIKYDTARSMGYAGGITALMAPDTNLHFGMKVLADAYKASRGDLCMTLARYQSGHLVTHASAANRAYCARARSYMARAS